MNTELMHTLLWFSVVWPLLLAIPQIHKKLPGPQYLALIPAIVLILLPGEAALALPWFLVGTDIALNSDNRWILVMAVLTWSAVVLINRPGKQRLYDAKQLPFLCIALSGNLALILTTDLIGFFSSATLMSYAFYGLLNGTISTPHRRHWNRYIILLVLADLALFEAMILAVSVSGNSTFEVVHQALQDDPGQQLYVWMSLLGFLLKLGIWPVHLWFFAVFNSRPDGYNFLPATVPVAMALFGMLKWLPLGSAPFIYQGGTVIIFGLLICMHAVVQMLHHPTKYLLPARASSVTTGLFIIAVGSSLFHPQLWTKVAAFGNIYIVFTMLLALCLSVITQRLWPAEETERTPSPDAHNLVMDSRMSSTLSSILRVIEQAPGRILNSQSLQHAMPIYHQTINRIKHKMQEPGWSLAITLFTLLAVLTFSLAYT